MKLSLLKSGTGIVRQYNNHRKIVKMSAVASGVSSIVAGHAFATKQPLEGTFFAGLVACTLSNAESSLLKMKKLKIDYNAILDRAKRIYNK